MLLPISKGFLRNPRVLVSAAVLYVVLKREEAHVCVACNALITVKLILIECADLMEIRKKYFEESLCVVF